MKFPRRGSRRSAASCCPGVTPARSAPTAMATLTDQIVRLKIDGRTYKPGPFGELGFGTPKGAVDPPEAAL
jgi:hypothetical protein